MSLILFLFYWIIIPSVIFVTGFWLWGSVNTTIAKCSIVTACFAALSGFLWIAVGETWWVDQQVKELCHKDGGVKIYETVKLSPEKYEELKRVNFILPNKNRLKQTDEYFYESESQWLKETRPRLLRSHSQIIRRNDGKVLGELVRYSRGAGGLPGPWHGSGFSCPDPVKQPSKFETAIFHIGN